MSVVSTRIRTMRPLFSAADTTLHQPPALLLEYLTVFGLKKGTRPLQHMFAFFFLADRNSWFLKIIAGITFYR